jgi:chromate reductase
MSLTLLGLSGSLRRDSLNTALLRTAVQRAPDDVTVEVHPLGDLPFFDADLEASGGHPAVDALVAAADQADGLLLAFPEYNWSVPAVLKNAIDWLSRGGAASPLHRMPAALLSAAGGSGGRRAQAHMRDILAHNDVVIVDEALQVARGRDHVVDGRLVSEVHVEQLDRVVEALVGAARARARTAA